MMQKPVQALKQTAADLGVSFKQALFHLFAEEFLRRLSASSSDAVLCGGYLTYAFSAMIARPFGELLFATAQPAAAFVDAVLAQDGAADIVLSRGNTTQSTVQVIGRWQTFSLPFLVQTTAQIPPKKDTACRTLPILSDGFSAPRVPVLTAPALIARTAAALVKNARFADCTAAIYDLYFFATQLDFEGAPLQKALRQTGISAREFAEALEDTAGKTAQKWRQATRATALAPTYAAAQATLQSFLLPLITADDRFEKNWSAEQERWQ